MRKREREDDVNAGYERLWLRRKRDLCICIHIENTCRIVHNGIDMAIHDINSDFQPRALCCLLSSVS